MRGLTLLCLVGFILTALLHEGGAAPPSDKAGNWHPLENPAAFPTAPPHNETLHLHLHPNNATHAGNATEVVHHNNTAAAKLIEDP
ncbi:growth arrest-specific 6 [Sarotherodon galilaeus]